MKQRFLLAVIFCLLTANVFAQTERAQKLDEFRGIFCDEYLARVDAVTIAQMNNPNAMIYVFIYEGKESRDVYKNGKFAGRKSSLPVYGSAKAKIASMKKYLKTRRMPLENYVFANGGFREQSEVEIWLVPPGAEAPQPTPTVQKVRYRKGKPLGFCVDCCGL